MRVGTFGIVGALLAVLLVAAPAAAEARCYYDPGPEHHDATVDLVESCVSYIGDRFEVSWTMRSGTDPRLDRTWWRPTNEFAAWASGGMYNPVTAASLLWDVHDGTPHATVWDNESAQPVQGCNTSWSFVDGTVTVAVHPASCYTGGPGADVAYDPWIHYGETNVDRLGSDDSSNYREPDWIPTNGTYGIRRLAGADRYATAAAVAARAFDRAEVVYVARGDQFADAVAGGSLTDGPVLLVPSCGPVPKVVADAVTRHRPDRVIALGGQAAVCGQVLRDAAQGRPTSRLAGTSRADTAVNISSRSFPDGSTTVYLARQDQLVDALAGGVLTDGPVLLVPPCGRVPATVTSRLAELAPRNVIALGGTSAVCPQVLDDATAAAGDQASSARLAGKDRYATAAKVATRLLRLEPGLPTLYAVNGHAPADAVAAGALTDGPIVFTTGCSWPGQAAADVARSRSWTTVIGVGGPAALCDHTFHVLAQPTTSTGTPPPDNPDPEPEPEAWSAPDSVTFLRVTSCGPASSGSPYWRVTYQVSVAPGSNFSLMSADERDTVFGPSGTQTWTWTGTINESASLPEGPIYAEGPDGQRQIVPADRGFASYNNGYDCG